ncbi:cGMP-dependent 3',5'-cyclic phosphodiesterase [Orchesella cincta]|uniref:Phosphodiesterase n=1 Tax=Orchesella cincta TaxID=48709 RepID=A0A1D2MN73_ORCCI|nr:cGMP-dependent 3',5'-cyclic phosphodiesterase [Orchesella cincta]
MRDSSTFYKNALLRLCMNIRSDHDLTSVDGNRATLANVQLPPRSSDIYDPLVQPFLSMETKFLDTFHTGGSLANQLNIARYIFEEVQTCTAVVILRMADERKSFRLYFRGMTACSSHETYKTGSDVNFTSSKLSVGLCQSDFDCVQEILMSKQPVIHNDDTGQSLTILCQWKPIFTKIPDIVVGIPIVDPDGNVMSIVAIAFKNKMPKGFYERKLSLLKETLEFGKFLKQNTHDMTYTWVPYACTNQGTSDNKDDVSRINRVLESIENIEKSMGSHSADIALTQIGTEIGNLGSCKNIVMFTVDVGDGKLRKYHSSFGHPGRSTCPNKNMHTGVEFSLTDKNVAALAWVAEQGKGMRINHASDLTEFGIHSKYIHTLGNCNSRSMLIAPVVDYSGESDLIIELSDKENGFTTKEFEMALIFCQHTACLLTCTILLDRRDKSSRRRNIINEMLCNISSVKPANVEQMISHHRKNSNVFRGNFDEYHFCVRCFPEGDIAGIAMEIFYELGIVKDFKVRRAVLVRFILSVQQGYGTLPYHNWYHAVSVSHFAYLLIRKLRLVDEDQFSKLEAFALIVSALTHDIDHRGTNNQFQSYTNSDIYKLYACEDSVMERHHLAIALAILHREDCNILESFNDSDYKYFVELLTWNIIGYAFINRNSSHIFPTATDISKHLKNREALFIEARSGNPKQRKMARMSLFMTAADLCDNCKRWDDSLLTVHGILQEFFNQGDMEKQLGFSPIPMMDREVAYIPMIEYKFVKYIVGPVFRYLNELYVELKPCMDNIQNNEDLWTLATTVFDKYRDIKLDQLEILEMPDMKEAALLKVNLEDEMDTVKKRKFSITIPPPGSNSVIEKKSFASAISLMDEEMDEVDTGEKQKFRNCCARLCCRKASDT